MSEQNVDNLQQEEQQEPFPLDIAAPAEAENNNALFLDELNLADFEKPDGGNEEEATEIKENTSGSSFSIRLEPSLLPAKLRQLTESSKPTIPTKSKKSKKTKRKSPRKSLTSTDLENFDDEMFEGEQQQQRSSASSLTIYLESLYQKRSGICPSLKSSYPPKSWPSSANLSKDSDVYPQESEYVVPYKAELRISESYETLEREYSIHTVRGIEEDSPHLNMRTLSLQRKSKAQQPMIEEEIESKGSEMTIVADEIEEEESARQNEFSAIENILRLPLNYNELKNICFPEPLLISCNISQDQSMESKSSDCHCKPVFHKSQLFDPGTVQEMGGMSLNIENARCNIITFCTTQFSLMGSAGASRILSVVDSSFQLIEEKKTEWHCTHEGKTEKFLHVAKSPGGYVAFRSITQDKKVKRDRADIRLPKSGDLVLDGGLFVLMRHLIFSKFSGELDFWSVTIDGELCTNKLIVGKKKLIYINDQPTLTIRIKRLLNKPNYPPEISKTYYLPTGQLVRHQWNGCRYFIHINPYGQIPPIPRHASMPVYDWKDDIVLVSKYLDEKEKRRSEIQTYMGDNPEIKSILQDYMLCLLQLKPQNVLDFSIEYFTNLFRD